MVHLLIVADNRMFIRQAYPLFDDSAGFTVHVVFHSTDIFDAYLQYRPDVVLLDGAIYLPISAILTRFAEYRWNCLLLVAGQARLPAQFSDHVVAVDIEHDDLRQLVLSHQLNRDRTVMPESLPLYITSAEDSPLQRSDRYHIMLSVCLEPQMAESLGSATIARFKAGLSAIGKVEICSVFQRDILILMRETTMRQRYGFARTHDILSRMIGLPFGSLYCEGVALDDLDSTCQKLLDHASASYCFGSQSLSLERLQKISHERVRCNVYPVLLRLLDCLFRRDSNALVETLQHLYENQIIALADLQALACFHRWQAFAERSILKPYIDAQFPVSRVFGCAGQECQALCQYWLDLLQRYQRNPFLAVSEAVVLYVMKNYHNPQLSLETISNELGFAKAYISRVLKENAGISFLDLLQQLRMEQALWLLRTTEQPIKEIALQVGYTDAQYFSKVFRRHTELQPTDYRNLPHKEV